MIYAEKDICFKRVITTKRDMFHTTWLPACLSWPVWFSALFSDPPNNKQQVVQSLHGNSQLWSTCQLSTNTTVHQHTSHTHTHAENYNGWYETCFHWIISQNYTTRLRHALCGNFLQIHQTLLYIYLHIIWFVLNQWHRIHEMATSVPKKQETLIIWCFIIVYETH